MTVFASLMLRTSKSVVLSLLIIVTLYNVFIRETPLYEDVPSGFYLYNLEKFKDFLYQQNFSPFANVIPFLIGLLYGRDIGFNKKKVSTKKSIRFMSLWCLISFLFHLPLIDYLISEKKMSSLFNIVVTTVTILTLLTFASIFTQSMLAKNHHIWFAQPL